MRWQQPGPLDAGNLGRDKDLRMKAKWNRYDLSLWDIRKLQLYGSAQESVQAAAHNRRLSAAMNRHQNKS